MDPATIILVSLSGSVLAWFITRFVPRHGGTLAALLPATLFIGLLTHWPTITADGSVRQAIEWVPTLGISFALNVDGFSFLFALLITGIGTLVTLYAAAYFADAPADVAARFVCLIAVFMTAMLGTVLADNLVVLFVFWELTGLTSFMLIGFEGAKPEARKAALQSLLVTAGGGLALFGAILLIGLEVGTFSLTEVAARSDELVASPYLPGIVVLLLVGALTKSAQFPFHFWLPNAMAAPTPASAYLHSATMVKLGVYLLARFDPILADLPAFGLTLVAVGSLTMVVAAINALRASGYKAVLAQSTVASLAILVMLIGLPGETAAVATVGFLLAHALYKAALFFCAGTAIHATHEPELRRIGGLVRFLPLTATAAIVASLSMAGLPPFVGFIAKEYLFEAQLESGSWLPILVAVLVNAVMVGIAGAVALRPFFLGRSRTREIHHGETAGLLVGPLTLAALGLAMGVTPGLMARPLVSAAASAIAGTPVEAGFSLWHGWTPMLALSACVVVLGSVLVWRWVAVQERVRQLQFLGVVDANAAYQASLDGILSLARLTTRTLQNGDLRRYASIVVVTVVAVLALVTVLNGMPSFRFGRPLEIAPIVVLVLALGGVAVAARAASLVSGLIGVGILGYASAVLFLMNGAPDLALTQFAAETLMLVIVMAVLLRVPTRVEPTRSRRERRFDAVVAAAFSVFVFVGLAAMLALPFDTRLTDEFAVTSYSEGQGRNVVNVVLVDFRALDTLGEIAVVGFATLAAWGLLRRRTHSKRTKL